LCNYDTQGDFLDTDESKRRDRSDFEEITRVFDLPLSCGVYSYNIRPRDFLCPFLARGLSETAPWHPGEERIDGMNVQSDVDSDLSLPIAL
jgi:hypothetical protein